MLADKPTLLLIDDEERILRSLAMLFRGQYVVHATTEPQEALRIVRQTPVHVVVSDQKMPRMRGSELLRAVRETSPNSMRILLTGYAELDAIVDSVNEGEIFRYINKPWDAQELRSTVAQAAGIARGLFAQPAAPAASTEAPMTSLPDAAPAAATGRTPAAPILLPGVGPIADGILVVDDDIEVFRTVQDITGSGQPVYSARSLEEMFAVLEKHRIGVIVSEMTVRRESLATSLKLLKAQYPEVVTIVLTPFEDAATLIGLINEGQIFRLLPKPVRRGPLSMNLASALRQHILLRSSVALRERYVVEKPRNVGEPGMAARIMGMLGRLRSRPQPLS